MFRDREEAGRLLGEHLAPRLAGTRAVVVLGIPRRGGAVARRSPREVVVAVPVAPPETVQEFAAERIRLEALETPSPFGAVGRFYVDFRQVEDDEVKAILRAQGH